MNITTQRLHRIYLVVALIHIAENTESILK